MAEAAHSLLSASGADGWSLCHGKPALEKGRSTTSAYAEEGKAAHELTKWVLSDRIGGGKATAASFIGTEIRVKEYDEQLGRWVRNVYIVDEDMAEHIDDFVDRFMLATRGRAVERFCEQRVHYHEYLGVPQDLAFGTTDAGAIIWDQPVLRWEDPTTGKVRVFPAGDELVVCDLKYGAGVMVFANTLQLKLYGVGTYWAWAHVANFTRVRLIIHQPRKDHYDEIVCTPEELIAAVEALRPAVPRIMDAMELAEAFRAEGLAPLQVGQALDARGFLKTSEKGCRFCDAVAICPANIAEVSEAVSGRAVSPEDFDDLTVDDAGEVREYGGNYLAAAYQRLDQIEHWGKCVRAEIDRRVLLKGETFDGIKVVAGKKGRRAWANPAKAEAFVQTKVPGPVAALLYKRVLLTPAQAEKALKTSPHTWARLQPLISQADGKPAVVSTSDSRRSISYKALVNDFEDLTAEEQPEPMHRGVSSGRDRHPFR